MSTFRTHGQYVICTCCERDVIDLREHRTTASLNAAVRDAEPQHEDCQPAGRPLVLDRRRFAFA